MPGISKIAAGRGVDLLEGEQLTLAASAARTAGANGSWIPVLGERRFIAFYLDITASATDAGDTLDVYIDASLDGTNSIGNVAHFTQQAGNGAAATEYACVGGVAQTAITVITADAVATAVRPGMLAPYYRARWAIVDSGDANSSHTFSVTGYAVR